MVDTHDAPHPAAGPRTTPITWTPVAEVGAAVARARAAQAVFVRMPVAERGRRIRRVGQLLAEQAERVAGVIAQETGKPVLEALTQEVLGIAHLAHYFGRRAKRILGRRRIRSRLFVWRQSYVHYAPRGVIAVIGPWNFPFALTCGDVLMALCAGNAVVLKPSEHTPVCALEIVRLVKEAGFDPALVQVVQGKGDVGDALVHAGVNMVHFTGSVPTGRRIAAACGTQLIPCVAELGGKDAALVFEDADLVHTAQTLAYGAFANAGQVCASVERVYAVGEAFAPLVAHVTRIAQSLRQSGPDDEIDVGPMVTRQQLDTVTRQVDAARAAGAIVHAGGTHHGAFYAPTVLTNVTDAMSICAEETFGPVLPIMQVATVEEAIARANNSLYGLSAYVFTRNVKRGLAAAEALVAGSVLLNEVLLTHAAAETPWGGVKDSGLGHTHADSGLRQMCQMRHVNYTRLPMLQNPWGYPYHAVMRGPVRDVLRGYFGGEVWYRRLGFLLRGLVGLLRHRPKAPCKP